MQPATSINFHINGTGVERDLKTKMAVAVVLLLLFIYLHTVV